MGAKKRGLCLIQVKGLAFVSRIVLVSVGAVADNEPAVVSQLADGAAFPVDDFEDLTTKFTSASLNA